MQENRIGQLMHAGGVISDALVSKQTLKGIRAVFAPKVS